MVEKYESGPVLPCHFGNFKFDRTKHLFESKPFITQKSKIGEVRDRRMIKKHSIKSKTEDVLSTGLEMQTPHFTARCPISRGALASRSLNKEREQGSSTAQRKNSSMNSAGSSNDTDSFLTGKAKLWQGINLPTVADRRKHFETESRINSVINRNFRLLYRPRSRIFYKKEYNLSKSQGDLLHLKESNRTIKLNRKNSSSILDVVEPSPQSNKINQLYEETRKSQIKSFDAKLEYSLPRSKSDVSEVAMHNSKSVSELRQIFGDKITSGYEKITQVKDDDNIFSDQNKTISNNDEELESFFPAPPTDLVIESSHLDAENVKNNGKSKAAIPVKTYLPTEDFKRIVSQKAKTMKSQRRFSKSLEKLENKEKICVDRIEEDQVAVEQIQKLANKFSQHKNMISVEKESNNRIQVESTTDLPIDDPISLQKISSRSESDLSTSSSSTKTKEVETDPARESGNTNFIESTPAASSLSTDISISNTSNFQRPVMKVKDMSDDNDKKCPYKSKCQSQTGTDEQLNLNYIVSTMQGKRSYNEDSYSVDSFYIKKKFYKIYTVFDGHGGSCVVNYLTKNFLNLVKEECYQSQNQTNSFNLEEAIKTSFKKADDNLFNELKNKSEPYNQGSCCSLAIIDCSENKLYVATLGDCRLVLRG